MGLHTFIGQYRRKPSFGVLTLLRRIQKHTEKGLHIVFVQSFFCMLDEDYFKF